MKKFIESLFTLNRQSLYKIEHFVDDIFWQQKNEISKLKLENDKLKIELEKLKRRVKK